MSSLITPLSRSWKAYKKCKPVVDEIEKAKQLDDDVGMRALQATFAQWLLSFLPGPVSLIRSAISTAADATLKDPAPPATDDFITGVHRILKKHHLAFDTRQDMQIIMDESYVATIPKETLAKFNMVQEFVTSAELVYKELTASPDHFLTVQEKHGEFVKHSHDVQNVRIDFVMEPETYLGEVVAAAEASAAANEGLYRTPRKETTMSSTTATFETHNHTPSPQVKCGNSGGKINFTILIPVIVISIPLGGPGGAAMCSIM